MKGADAYAQLRQLDRPVFTTREAAALWRSEQTSASRRLGRLGEAGLVLRIQRGLWAVDPEIEPRVLGPLPDEPAPFLHLALLGSRRTRDDRTDPAADLARRWLDRARS